jgi:hypothetical protein
MEPFYDKLSGLVNDKMSGYSPSMKNELDWAAVKAAANELGIKPRTVEKWQEPDRGVPFKWWYPIVRIARGRVTIEALEHSRDGP